MLDSQIDIYSVDTGHFYSNHEKYLHDMNCKYRKERNYINNKLVILKQALNELGFNEENIKDIKINKLDALEDKINAQSQVVVDEFMKWTHLTKMKKRKADESKNKLLLLLSNKVNQNEITNGKDHIRQLREGDLNDKNVISIFESSLTRSIGIKKDELSNALLVVQIYYFDVFKDMSFFGFVYNGERYEYFTSSAGQIRKKKAVFIKQSVWNKIEKTIMCGLTMEIINLKGGNNVNKHLAYMALSNSATNEWEDFDIDRCIVIDDFETNVYGTFDYIDDTDYSITRKTDFIPVTHTDGAGMMLPSVMNTNTMFRAPWIKGLLGVFDFLKFVLINNYSPVIVDIYGQEHDIIKENILIIFTKSQFKMYKYYNSWNEYKEYFKRYHCQAGICNTEEGRVKNAKINYQMLQTLTNITEDEIKNLASKSITRITNICNSKETMLDILGVTPYNNNMTPFQKSLKIYPTLLNDTYVKDIIREVKDSLLTKYRSGKLEINGKYTFLLPDYYAACEYWFGRINLPPGLLADKEVFCSLFSHYDKLDCLRSPHLYKEHAIRFNVANSAYGDRFARISEWFTTKALYTSTYDLISKVLMFDVDGDKSLVVADPDFVRIAERNMNGVVPLYYNMRKSDPTELNHKTIYAGLNAAFTHGNIGIYSNNISKIWNNDVFINGTDEEKKDAVDCIKRLCCQNNFVIDYAKTLYKPDFPRKINEQISKYTKSKLPAFFKYAKDKEDKHVEERNASLVNTLYRLIPNKPINTRGLRLEKLNYRKLMKNINIICSKDVSDLYDKLNREYRYKVNMKDEYIDNLHYVFCNIRGEFEKLGYSENTISDMLVQYLYGNEKRAKQLLWFCYGEYISCNLENNILAQNIKYIQCIDCGEWMEVSVNSKRIRCDSCSRQERKVHNQKMYQKRNSTKLT